MESKIYNIFMRFVTILHYKVLVHYAAHKVCPSRIFQNLLSIRLLFDWAACILYRMHNVPVVSRPEFHAISNGVLGFPVSPVLTP